MSLALALLLSASAQGASFGCDSGKLAYSVRATGGHTLFVCAVNSIKKKGRREISGFRVFASGTKKKKPLFESEPENVVYAVFGRGKELVIQELVWDGKENVPAFESVFSCEKTGCARKAGNPACVFQKPKSGSRRALELIGDFQHGKNKGKVPDPKLINLLAALAYSGDPDAQAVFRDRGALTLDGESGETYFEHQSMLQRLKKASCL